MTRFLIVLPCLILAAEPAEQVIDKVCPQVGCRYLVVRGGQVTFIDSAQPAREIPLGTYIQTDQKLVPRTEAPIRELRSARGWRVVISTFLDHKELDAWNTVRFFSPSGRLERTSGAQMSLMGAELGKLFGGDNEVVVVTSYAQHVYNTQTMIWAIPQSGKPKLLLDLNGSVERIVRGDGGTEAGVWISRNTYDGVDASTKGSAAEFWRWDAKKQALAIKR
ncbi:MAG: hypothetical protein ABSF62_19480 [Bryobacteraceae bacterium]|jgi:hypothetical protein